MDIDLKLNWLTGRTCSIDAAAAAAAAGFEHLSAGSRPEDYMLKKTRSICMPVDIYAFGRAGRGAGEGLLSQIYQPAYFFRSYDL